MRSEGVLEQFYAVFAFRLLLGWQTDPDPDLETLPKISTAPDPDPKGDEPSCARAHA